MKEKNICLDAQNYKELREAMIEHPKEVAYSYKNKSITYSEFVDNVNETFYGLRRLNLKNGDNIIVCLPECLQAAESFFAIDKAGLYAYTVAAETSEPAIAVIAEEADCKAIISTVENYEKVVKAIAGVNHAVKIILADTKNGGFGKKTSLRRKLIRKKLKKNAKDYFVVEWEEMKDIKWS